MEMAVKALVFDVFGTVVDWRSSLIEQFEEFGAEKGLTVDWAGFVDDWKKAYKPGMDAVREGRWPWTNVEGIYRKKIDELASQYGLEQLSESDRTGLARAWHRLKPWPDVVEGLERLKSRYVLSTLSNGDVACLVNMAKYGSLPWDCILCAEIFRHYKPDPEVYRGAIQLLGFEPQETMLVAAHNYDLAAAQSHGMRTAFVARPQEFGLAQTSDLKAEGNWDIIAEDFGELASALNRS